jgi:hypothetical protein
MGRRRLTVTLITVIEIAEVRKRPIVRRTPRMEQSMLEAEPEDADDAEHEVENQFEHGMDHGDGGHERGDHGGMHAGHEQLFRRRFFVSTLLSIPLLLYSETLHIYTLWIRSDSSSSPQTPRSSAIASDGFTAG